MAAPSPDKRVPTIAELAALGASEVLVEVARYRVDPGNRGPDHGSIPVEWRATITHVNAANPATVAVRGDPDEADRDARRFFAEMHGKPHKVALMAAARAKPKPPAKPAAAPADDDMDDLV